jgi:hypothetical protein
MSDTPKKPQLETGGPDPLLARSRVLAAAREVQVTRAQRLDTFGVTAMEVKLWCEARGPKAHGLNVDPLR